MKLFHFLDDEVDETKPKIDSISSGYPTEELMERFAEIVKGRTYLHRPNQSLNLYLTAALAVSFFLVIGLGFGHFKGKKKLCSNLYGPLSSHYYFRIFQHKRISTL